MNKIFENIYNSNNKSHLKENDFFVGSSGQLQSEINPDECRSTDVPDFVKQFFGFDNGPMLVATYDNVNIPEGLGCDGYCEKDCTNTNVEYKPADSCGTVYSDDKCDSDWLDLSNLQDESPVSAALNLIQVTTGRTARSESGTNQDTVITVDGLTDNDKIRELIDIISGTLNSGKFSVEGYRLCDGNLQLRICK